MITVLYVLEILADATSTAVAFVRSRLEADNPVERWTKLGDKVAGWFVKHGPAIEAKITSGGDDPPPQE